MQQESLVWEGRFWGRSGKGGELRAKKLCTPLSALKTNMSRVGKKPLNIPENVVVSVEGLNVKISGPKGELDCSLPAGIEVKVKDGQLLVSRLQDTKFIKSLHGTTQRVLGNALKGVLQSWEKTLELVGTGYRARLEGGALVLAIGFSHPVKFDPPEGISFSVEENKVTVSGRDRHLVGQVAANIRAVRPPEPYKGKGVRYLDEYVRRKSGKAAKAVAA